MDYSKELRRRLVELAESYAVKHELAKHCYRSTGSSQTVLFRTYRDGAQDRNGNFSQASYGAILDNPCWRQRLAKRHTQIKALSPKDRNMAQELDSCTSSDALLMNIFCHPSCTQNLALGRLLGFNSMPNSCFGFKAGLPMSDGTTERRSTEIDLALFENSVQTETNRKVFIESKLTERDFTNSPKGTVEAYKDFTAVFDSTALPKKSDGQYDNYQLIRNILTAHRFKGWFYLVHDERRPDLKDKWDIVKKLIHSSDLSDRCGSITWQQIACQLPADLQEFLRDKYGIEGKPIIHEQ